MVAFADVSRVPLFLFDGRVRSRRTAGIAAWVAMVVSAVLSSCGGSGPQRLALVTADVPTVFASALAPLDTAARTCVIGVLGREGTRRGLVSGDTSKTGRGRALAATLSAWDGCGLLPAGHRSRSEFFQDPLQTVTEKERRCLTGTNSAGPPELPLTLADVQARGSALKACVFGASRRAALIATDLGVATSVTGQRPEAPCVLDRLVQNAGTWKAIMLYRGLFATEWTDDDVVNYVAALDGCGDAPVLGEFNMRAYVRLGRAPQGESGQAPTDGSTPNPGDPVVPTAPPSATTIDPVF